MARRLIHQSVKDQAVQDYVKGESSESIGKRIKVDPSAIRKWIRSANHKIRNQVEAQKRCTLDESAFSIPSASAFYWAGFLVADGTVCGNKELALVLAACDVTHIEKFRQFLGSNHKIVKVLASSSTYGGDAYRLGIKSSDLVEDLKSYGFNGKSLERFAGKSSVNSRDFWRGVIDGDGYLGISNEKSRLELIGGETLCKQFAEYVNKVTGSSLSARPSKGGTYVVQASCGTAEKIAANLYQGAETFLDRKKSKADEIINAAQVNLIWAKGSGTGLSGVDGQALLETSVNTGGFKQLVQMKRQKLLDQRSS